MSIQIYPRGTSGWKGGKPSYGSSSYSTYKNKQYFGGGSKWSKPSSKPSLSKMTPNTKYRNQSDFFLPELSLKICMRVIIQSTSILF